MIRDDQKTDLDRRVKDIPWVQPEEPEQFPDHTSCQLCLETLAWDAPGPLCGDCIGGFGELFGRDAPAWGGQRSSGVVRRGEDEGAVERDGWLENGVRGMEDAT